MSTKINEQCRTGASLSRRVSGAASGIVVAVLLITGLAASPAHAEGTILGAGHPDAIPGSYIVALKDAGMSQSTIATHASGLAGQYGGKIGFVYDAAMTGFSIKMDEAAARKLAADPSVAYVEQDLRVELHGSQPNPPSWGLDRIDRRERIYDELYVYPNTAPNVNIYILDTGVRLTHTEFGGRAFTGFDAVTSGGTATDCNGHGTHVAATAAGAQYGVAKQARIHSVRVLNCGGDGANSVVMAGVDWVTSNAVKPAVANMSLGTNGIVTSLNNAVSNSIASGITYVVSAGNDNADACGYSPATVPAAITVGATNTIDGRMRNVLGARFGSNIGSCLDIFAPGDYIWSAGHDSDTATRRMRGTSMAAPHVAGAAAMILSARPTWTPAQVTNRIIAVAATGMVSSAGTGSPNRLLHTGGPPMITSFHCESGNNQLLCSVSYQSAAPVTITWYRNAVAVPAWNNQAAVFSTCDSSTTVRAVVANPDGSVSTSTWGNCRSGPWQ